MRRPRREGLIDLGGLPHHVRAAERPLRTMQDLDPLLARIGDAGYVLLGEASHGTSESYTWRRRLTQRLIVEKHFSFVAVEGDWPACYEVNRAVKGFDDEDRSSRDVLLDAFRRWPEWMWANAEVLALVEWLGAHNASLDAERRVGVYGLDVYSLWESLAEVLRYLERHDPGALPAAYEAYRCFEPYAEDERAYARATALVPTSCEREVVKLLAALRENARAYPADPDARLSVERNAEAVAGAERHYRTTMSGGGTSWNVRDRHMIDTLDHLVAHHCERSGGGKAIVWAHNTHVGDARATDMVEDGMVNLGQLARERHADDGVVLVGFASFTGRVIAAGRWGAPARRLPLPEAKAGSWEAVFAEAGPRDRLVITDELSGGEARVRRGHRAVGVVYDPDRERGNYVPTVLPDRYDAVIYLHETTGLHPLAPEPVSLPAQREASAAGRPPPQP